MQYITKKHVSRREVLRGIGAALSLPLLDAMAPAATAFAATAAAPKTRLCCIEMVHGAAGSTGEGGNKHLGCRWLLDNRNCGPFLLNRVGCIAGMNDERDGSGDKTPTKRDGAVLAQSQIDDGGG